MCCAQAKENMSVIKTKTEKNLHQRIPHSAITTREKKKKSDNTANV